MRRRILGSIVVVAAVAIVLFGIPLAVAAGRLFQREEITRLEREASLSAGALSSSEVRDAAQSVVLQNTFESRDLALYDVSGQRLAGLGPSQGGAAVLLALQGRVGEDEQDGELRVAVPILDDEQILGAVESSLPIGAIDARTRTAWLAMVILGGIVLVVAAGIARRQARRLAEPIGALAGALERLGNGDFSARTDRSGIAELDAAGGALDATATRLGEVLARERAFSAHASHQLSTPLTGLRITLEGALLAPGADLREAMEEAIGEADRLQLTIAELLALARDTERNRERIDLHRLLDDLERRWSRSLALVGRRFVLAAAPDLPKPDCSPTAVGEILDVLVGNSSVHGAGTVTLRARRVGEGAVLEVEDEGGGIAANDISIFEHRRTSGEGHGIGLSLACALAAEEGGRLLLRRAGPHPVFALVLPGGIGSVRPRPQVLPDANLGKTTDASGRFSVATSEYLRG